MSRPGQPSRDPRTSLDKWAFVACYWLLAGCSRPAPEKAIVESASGRANASPAPSSAPAASAKSAGLTLPPAVSLSQVAAPPGTPVISPTASGPQKVDFQDAAMGTNVHFIAYSNDHVDTAHIQ